MKPTNKIKIIAPNRIHITLLSMDDSSYRKNGGIGFSINAKNLEIDAEQSSDVSISDPNNLFETKKINKITELLENTRKELCFKFGPRIEIINGPAPHVGLGSGTSLHLACIESLFLVNDKRFTQDELIKISGRGGTSGIGINTYFSGGFVFDLGRKYDETKHTPSSRTSLKFEKPLTVLAAKMPQWNLGICIPKGFTSISEEEEIQFFNTTCPISKKDVEEILYHAVLGTVSGILESDRFTFCKSVNAIQKTKWKASEINLYGDNQKDLIERLSPLCECIGMSSLGPALYFISDDIESIISTFKNNDSLLIEKVTVNNTGREILYV